MPAVYAQPTEGIRLLHALRLLLLFFLFLFRRLWLRLLRGSRLCRGCRLGLRRWFGLRRGLRRRRRRTFWLRTLAGWRSLRPRSGLGAIVRLSCWRTIRLRLGGLRLIRRRTAWLHRLGAVVSRAIVGLWCRRGSVNRLGWSGRRSRTLIRSRRIARTIRRLIHRLICWLVCWLGCGPIHGLVGCGLTRSRRIRQVRRMSDIRGRRFRGRSLLHHGPSGRSGCRTKSLHFIPG